tara:strand:+ start:391 stop:576 length:186 start_codon:yes stop_codon:yes gene_type:complete
MFSIKKLKKKLLTDLLPKWKTKSVEEEVDDEPDYRYGDFRDEIRDVERIRTIGGNYDKKES